MLAFSRRIGGKVAVLCFGLLIWSIWQGLDNFNRPFFPSKLDNTVIQFKVFEAEESVQVSFKRYIPLVKAHFFLETGELLSRYFIVSRHNPKESSHLASYTNRGPPSPA